MMSFQLVKKVLLTLTMILAVKSYAQDEAEALDFYAIEKVVVKRVSNQLPVMDADSEEGSVDKQVVQPFNPFDDFVRASNNPGATNNSGPGPATNPNPYRPNMAPSPAPNNNTNKTNSETLKSVQEVVAVIREIVAVGKEVWSVVEKGRAVATTELTTISALPRIGEKLEHPALHDMTSWAIPGSQTYVVDFKNYLGMTVIHFKFSVFYQPGGKYNGKGQYLTGVGVSADELKIVWGFDFDAKTSLISLTNQSDDVENPIAGLVLKLDYTAKSAINEARRSVRFFIAGDGTFKML